MIGAGEDGKRGADRGGGGAETPVEKGVLAIGEVEQETVLAQPIAEKQSECRGEQEQ